MLSSVHDGSLEARRDALRRALATVGDFRQGSLTPRYIKCGKANCHCAHEGAQGHGPYWSLTREVNGKTRTRTVPGTALERVRELIAEYHLPTGPIQRDRCLKPGSFHSASGMCVGCTCEDGLGRIRTESADWTAHAVRVRTRRRSLEPEIERDAMVLCLKQGRLPRWTGAA